MEENKTNLLNSLVLYRHRMRLSQRQVATLLDHKDTTRLSKLEAGHAFPGLKTSLKLAAIYRAPVEFLFPNFFLSIREDIRAKELQLAPIGQGVLFKEYL